LSISVNNLSKNYGQQVAVNNISFQLSKGEIVGFLGPNGAGKSTTMKMITGYLEPDKGIIEVCGIPSGKNSLDVKKKIGYLPEANPLYPEMYVREYLQFIANIHSVSNPQQTIENIIDTVGLRIESNKKIGQLSKGYKQRVGLAAALIHSPEVLILDEPTSGLDPNQIVEIRNVIKSLAVQKTILFSSHIMQEVEAICDRVIIISKGNIVADEKLAVLRNTNSAEPFVMVEFQEEINRNELAGLPGISHAEFENGQYRLSGADQEKIRQEVLKYSLEKNLNIVSIQNRKQTLESVFKDLTS